MQRADLDRLEPRAPAKRVHRVASRREQMAASALARANPFPPRVPVGDVRQVLRAREADVAEPAAGAEPPRELQKRIEPEHERHDRAHAGLPHGVANPYELRLVEAGRLFEHEVFAGARGGDRLVGMQMIRGRDRDDVDVARRERLVKAGCEARARQRQPGPGERRASTLDVAHDDPRHVGLRIPLKRRDVLRRAPADSAHGHAQFLVHVRPVSLSRI